MSYVPIYAESSFLTRTKDHENSWHILRNRFKSAPPEESRSKGNGKQCSEDNSATYPIIVHCHLCWDWVWQRPQQFLSRLSKKHKILFVETRAPDPNLVAPLARWESIEAFPNV